MPIKYRLIDDRNLRLKYFVFNLVVVVLVRGIIGIASRVYGHRHTPSPRSMTVTSITR